MASIQSLPAELLDSILQHLSQRELLLDQRVCQQWRQVIQQSPQLQRTMFLGFVPSGRISKVELSRFVLDNTRTPRPSHDRVESETTLDEKASQQQQGMDTAAPPTEQSSGPLVHFNRVFPSEGDVIRMRTMQFRAKLESPESWLDMFLTQPPCSQAEVTVFYKRSSASGFKIFGRKSDTAMCVVNVVKPDGVRARDVLHAARARQGNQIKKWQRIDICVPGVVRG